jgi:hypothetical protein
MNSECTPIALTLEFWPKSPIGGLNYEYSFDNTFVARNNDRHRAPLLCGGGSRAEAHATLNYE